MRKRWWIALVVAVVAAASVTVAVAVDRAQGSPTLQDLSVTQLLDKVATASKSRTAMSGDVSWSNGLVPGSGLSSLLSGQSSVPTSLNGLLTGGSGRLWLQPGSGLRLEVQGTNGDFVVVAGKHGLWTYSSQAGTATRYDRPADATASASATPMAQTKGVDPVVAINAELQHLASIGTVSLSQGNAADRPSYLLTMRPTSTTTTVGAVQVAVDARTFVPLRLEVFAKGDDSAVLSAGFTSISYGRLSPGLFDFTPPAGATVRRQTLPSLSTLFSGASPPSTKSGGTLTLPRLETRARALGLALALPDQRALPRSLAFTGASLIAGPKSRSATAVLRYGPGFGTLVLVETSGQKGLDSTLQQQLAHLPRALIATVIVNGRPGYELGTPLATMATWRQGATTVLAGGTVPQDLVNVMLAAMR
jgi:outer membrane lipoprotein-sorting protein